MSWLNISEELLNNVEEQSIATGGTLESGVYTTKIKQAFVRKTDSGATMFELEGESQDGKSIYWSTCVKSGDAKGNKATYTDKNGKEQLLPGVTSVIHLFEAIGMSMTEEQPVNGKVSHRDNEIEAGIFKGLTGKVFKACIRQYEDEYNGEIKIKYDIENFLNTDGKNKRGENLEEKFLKKIAGSPIKLLKKKASASTPSVASAEAAASGW